MPYVQISLLTLYFLSYLLCISFSVRHYLHIFQLNSYKPKVQADWMIKNKKTLLIKAAVAVFIIPIVMFMGNIGLTLAGIYFIIIAYTNRMKKVKKPLVYTKRIVRMLITISLISLPIALSAFIPAFMNYADISKGIFSCVTVGYFMVIPFVVLLANYINKPIEYSINRKFIKEAEKIISSMSDLKVIGITGSYGKTSVKYYLTQLLSAKYDVLMTPESYNTTLGVVRTVREKMRATHQMFVCEMGARNVGDIKEICDIVSPKYAVITSIGPQHLESFKTLDNIKKTKFELADSLPEDGIAFLNADDENIMSMHYKGNAVYYGIDKGDYMAFDLCLNSKGTVFKLKTPSGEIEEFTTKLIGRHNVENITGAIAAANTLGVPLKSLIMPVKRLEGVPHRLQLIQNGDTLIIDDAYNSNPNGTKVALNTLSMFEGVKILVTPGMVELGEKQDEYNYKFGENAADVCDYIFLIGKKQTKSIYDGVLSKGYPTQNLFVCEDIKEAFEKIHLLKTEESQKVILLENDLPDNFL